MKKSTFNLFFVLLPAMYLTCIIGIIGASPPFSLHAKDEIKELPTLHTEQIEAYMAVKFYLKLYAFNDAEGVVNSYLEKYPNDPFLLTEKAYLLKNLKNEFHQARKILEKAHTIYPKYYYSNYLYASLLYFQYTSVPDAGPTNDPERNHTLRDAVIKYLETSVKSNDQFYESLFLLGVVLSDKGEFRKSNELLEKASQIMRTSEAYFHMAVNYRNLKDSKSELEAYEKVLNFNPYNYRALTALAQIHLDRNDFKNAAKYLGTLYQQNPEDPKKKLDYLYTLFAAGDAGKFLEISDTVDISASPLLVYAKALFLSQKNRLDEALELLDGMEKKDFKANLLTIEIYRQKQDYYRAYRILETISPKERNYLFYSLQLELFATLNLNNRILGVFNTIKKDPTILEKLAMRDYYNFVIAYTGLNQPAQLREFLRFIKKKTKENSPSATREAKAFHDLEKAVTNLLKKKPVKSENIRLDLNRYIIVSFLKNQKRYTEAINLIDNIIKNSKKKTPGPYLELGEIYMEQNNPEKAEANLIKLQKMFPDSVEVRNFVAYSMAKKNKDLEKALELSAETLKKDGENLAYLDTYGYILFKMGRTDEAVAYLEKAYRKNPFEPEILEHLASYYRLKQNHQKIIEIYQHAIDHDVDFKGKLEGKIKGLKK